LLAKSLAILTSYPKPEEAYLTGLLHNIGELVLSRNFNKEYLTLREEQPDEDKRLKHELGTFGIDHAELGAQLANEWGLSPYAIDAIRYHHANTVDILGAQHLVKILYAASALSNDAQQSMQQSVETTNSLFELNPSLISEICRKIDEEVIQVAESMGVQLDKQDDQEAHISLARAIRDQNLQNISRDLVSKAKTKIELATQIQHSLSLLLGTRQTALFWNEDNELVLIEDSY
ncbi:HDOD domain-containing protein, partial [Oleiphilus sp. HI0125]